MLVSGLGCLPSWSARPNAQILGRRSPPMVHGGNGDHGQALTGQRPSSALGQDGRTWHAHARPHGVAVGGGTQARGRQAPPVSLVDKDAMPVAVSVARTVRSWHRLPSPLPAPCRSHTIADAHGRLHAPCRLAHAWKTAKKIVPVHPSAGDVTRNQSHPSGCAAWPCCRRTDEGMGRPTGCYIDPKASSSISKSSMTTDAALRTARQPSCATPLCNTPHGRRLLPVPQEPIRVVGHRRTNGHCQLGQPSSGTHGSKRRAHYGHPDSVRVLDADVHGGAGPRTHERVRARTRARTTLSAHPHTQRLCCCCMHAREAAFARPRTRSKGLPASHSTSTLGGATIATNHVRTHACMLCSRARPCMRQQPRHAALNLLSATPPPAPLPSPCPLPPCRALVSRTANNTPAPPHPPASFPLPLQRASAGAGPARPHNPELQRLHLGALGLGLQPPRRRHGVAAARAEEGWRAGDARSRRQRGVHGQLAGVLLVRRPADGQRHGRGVAAV